MESKSKFCLTLFLERFWGVAPGAGGNLSAASNLKIQVDPVSNAN